MSSSHRSVGFILRYTPMHLTETSILLTFLSCSDFFFLWKKLKQEQKTGLHRMTPHLYLIYWSHFWKKWCLKATWWDDPPSAAVREASSSIKDMDMLKKSTYLYVDFLDMLNKLFPNIFLLTPIFKVSRGDVLECPSYIHMYDNWRITSKSLGPLPPNPPTCHLWIVYFPKISYTNKPKEHTPKLNK